MTTSVPIDNWTGLAGLTVQIRKDGRLVCVGQVETVTPTADVLWLRYQGVEPRKLFQKAEGYTVWSVTDSSMTIKGILSDGTGERIILRIPVE